MDRLLDVTVALCNLFWFSSAAYHYTFCLGIRDPESTEGCSFPWPVSLIVSEIIFACYSLLVLILIIVGIIVLYFYYKDVLVHDRMKIKVEKILQDAYFDKDAVTNFYMQHRDELKEEPIFPVEMIVFKDQFEKEFRFLPN